jgi:hypothetical protein
VSLCVQLVWDVPVTDRRIAAYCLTAKEHDDDPSDDQPPNYFELTDTFFVFNRFHGEPIDPGESFLFHVQLRYMDDPGAARRGGGRGMGQRDGGQEWGTGDGGQGWGGKGMGEGDRAGVLI